MCSSLVGKQGRTVAVQTEAPFTADFVYGLDTVYHEIRAAVQKALAEADQERLPLSTPFNVENPAPPDADPFSLLSMRSQLCAERLRSLLRADLRHLSGVQWVGSVQLANRMAMPEPCPTKIRRPSGWVKIHTRVPAIAAPAAQQTKPNEVQMDASSLIPDSAAYSSTKFVRAVMAAKRLSLPTSSSCLSPDTEATANNKLPALSHFRSLTSVSSTSLSTNTASEEPDVSAVPSVAGNMMQSGGLRSSHSFPVLSRRSAGAEEPSDGEETTSPKLRRDLTRQAYAMKWKWAPSVRVSSEPLI